MKLPEITDGAADSGFRRDMVDLLTELIEIDTTPNADVKQAAANEHAVFDKLEAAIGALGLDGVAFDRRAIDPKIAEHPYFSKLYYTKTKDNPDGLTAAQCYDGRANLMVYLDGDQASGDGLNYAVNTHIDVVAPFIGPSVDGDIVYGRGACDDKGNAVAMIGALRLVADYLKKTGRKLNKNLTFMFVIEEETGGNGSLSAALDADLKKRYDALTVMEICESRLFPGNRGCVWYKVEASLPGVNLFEAAAFIIAQMEREGRSIRAESRHDLFPHRPVQTCHGIIGDCGEHPSRINGRVAFDIVLDGDTNEDTDTLVTDVIGFALQDYCGVYGDKTKVNDPTTGKPKVDHHYDLEKTDHGYTVTVHGSTGHMGSIFENDGAITKMMTMVRALMRSGEAIKQTAGANAVSFRQHGWDDVSQLILEGGQGFLPTHEMEDVQSRITAAVHRGANHYLRMKGNDANAADVFTVTFEKLHNAAFAGSVDSFDMQAAIECAKAADIWKDEPVRGWDVSCDSRIFAKTYPDMNVITTGPGSLNYAHSDAEQISVTEMTKFSEFLAYYILKMTGTI